VDRPKIEPRGEIALDVIEATTAGEMLKLALLDSFEDRRRGENGFLDEWKK
jgi:hypothetical protein